jgi:hypothetical protein
MSNVPFTTSTNAAIVPEIWSARFYEVLRAALPFIGSVSTDYQGEIQSLGDTVNISTIEDFDQANELGEGAAGDTDLTTISGQQLVINKRLYKDYAITKRAQLQSLPFMDSLREKAVFAINKKMHQVIIDAIVPSAATPDNTLAYDAATTLALSDILKVKEDLDTQNVPMDSRVAVLGAAQWNDIFNITGFVSRDFIPSGSPLTTGDIPVPLAGFMPKLTTVVGNTSYWFHPSFMTMAIQQALNIAVYDLGVEGIRAARVNVDLLMGLKQLSNIRVVTLS